jgi:hypothetical protein
LVAVPCCGVPSSIGSVFPAPSRATTVPVTGVSSIVVRVSGVIVGGRGLGSPWPSPQPIDPAVAPTIAPTIASHPGALRTTLVKPIPARISKRAVRIQHLCDLAVSLSGFATAPMPPLRRSSDVRSDHSRRQWSYTRRMNDG